MKIKVKVGDSAPNFDGVTADGSTLTIKHLAGKNVVLYFYPKDDTPGCTREACNFRDDLKIIRDLGAEIIGVSLDTVESHRKFAAKYNLPFPLVSDKDKRIAKAYGVLKNTGTSTNRVTFIIDKNGKIAKIFPRVDVKVHSKEIAEALKELL